jgi:hypothetical protein
LASEIPQVPKKPLEITGYLVGPQLLWVRAYFDLPTVQVNTSNHLTVELHSKVTGAPIKFSKIVLRFNENSMNQEITGDFTLEKGTPFKVEREMYISKDNQIQRDFIQFTEVYIELAKGLAFMIKPYLKP